MIRFPCATAGDGHCGCCGTPGNADLPDCPARLRAALDAAVAKLERVREARDRLRLAEDHASKLADEHATSQRLSLYAERSIALGYATAAITAALEDG